jgi:hypothetical protein
VRNKWPPNVTSAEQNAALWLEFFGLVDVFGGTFLNPATRRNVTPQIAALNELGIDWTKKQNLQWLLRNWSVFSTLRLPKKMLLISLRLHGPSSKDPSEPQLKFFLERESRDRQARKGSCRMNRPNSDALAAVLSKRNPSVERKQVEKGNMQVIVLVNGQLLDVNEMQKVPYVGEVVNVGEVDYVVTRSGVSCTPSIRDKMPVINLLPVVGPDLV